MNEDKGKRKRSTLFALMFIIAVVVIASSALFTILLVHYRTEDLIARADTRLLMAAELTREILGADYHDRIVDEKSVSKEQFRRLVERNDDLCRRLNLQYLWSVLLVDNRLVFTSATHSNLADPNSPCASFFETHHDPESFAAALPPEGKTSLSSFNNEWGQGRMVLIPSKDVRGRTYIFGASVQLAEIDTMIRWTILTSIGIGLVIIAVTFLLAMILVRSFTAPISQLTEAAEIMATGDLDVPLVPAGSLEMKSLFNSLDKMRQGLQQHIAALRDSEEKYRTVADFTYDWEYWIGPDGKFFYASPSCERVSGYKVEEFLRDPKLLENIVHQDDKYLLNSHIHDSSRGISEACKLEFRIITRDNKEIWIDHICQDVYSLTGEYLGRRSSNRDITDRKRMEEELQRTNAFLNSIVENIPDMIFLKDACELRFIRFNRAGEDLLGYPREDLLGKNDYDFFPREQADFFTEKDRNVLREKKIVDILEEPIQTRNKGARILHTKKVPILDEKGNPAYLLGISEDMTERKQAEQKLQQTLESLRKAFGTIIQVLVSAVETRDPYTAGHQNRSADLARAIAAEVGFSQDKIDGIRMAGSIHDIGKLSIPAEILAKPTKLSEIEFPLIRQHAQKGYEMLKDVESPWPLAEIVYQHHERMDGSGYPRGLKGEEILIEARILAVADVVESMASHRPYRPALGLAAALEEIENNKRTLYDADAVDACLRLFREKGFKFEGHDFTKIIIQEA